jgi:hypothetical protein
MRSFHLFPSVQWNGPRQGLPQALIWLWLLAAVCCLTIVQDYLQAQRNGYGFYLSESALFKVFWLLFWPVSVISLKIFGQWRPTANPSALGRVAAFVCLASIAHILLFAASVSGLSALLFDHTYTPDKVLSYTLSEDIYKYILIYGGIAWLRLPRRTATDHQTPTPTPPPPTAAPALSAITLGNGLRQTVVATDEIFFIAAASPYIAIHTAHKKHLHTCTLKSIEGQLDTAQFVRIHKSTIVNVQAVAACRSRLNGDYDLELRNGQQLRLSRHYVAAFRQRFGHG